VRGFRVARKRVWRLMRAAGPRGRHPRAWRRTTTAGERPIDAPDLIGQDFTAEAPNTRWCGDIERHEALWNRVEVGDLRRRVVAAAR
jgi:putative transposase